VLIGSTIGGNSLAGFTHRLQLQELQLLQVMGWVFVAGAMCSNFSVCSCSNPHANYLLNQDCQDHAVTSNNSGRICTARFLPSCTSRTRPSASNSVMAWVSASLARKLIGVMNC